ncbi:unnamed protein product [Ilex paraguariensis]|uniref:Secreted protein n=1 Tax=Ilex paraguariensis TaxID=185542 RepID=A0ABC8SF65_9AQUA
MFARSQDNAILDEYMRRRLLRLLVLMLAFSALSCCLCSFPHAGGNLTWPDDIFPRATAPCPWGNSSVADTKGAWSEERQNLPTHRATYSMTWQAHIQCDQFIPPFDIFPKGRAPPFTLRLTSRDNTGCRLHREICLNGQERHCKSQRAKPL